MKQNLNIGQVVDDGSGDYLRAGGQKINNNFDELYNQLGDGKIPHSAGAWKTWTASNGTTLSPVFGSSYAINTQAGRINVKLPKGTPADYNKVIRIRDVWSTWRISPITVTPASGDTMKGSASPKIFNTNYQDLEMVYCSPGRWEYVESKTVDKLMNGDLATVAKKSFIAKEGQTDFLNIFNGEEYNSKSINVYRRGNLLYYGIDNEFDSENADYGSPGTEAGKLIALNNKDIRLKVPCNAGDVIVVETFLDGIGVWRSSYNRITLQMRSKSNTSLKTIAGSIIVDDLSTKKTITIDDLGVLPGIDINPHSVEVELNGKTLIEAGTAGLPTFYCEGSDGNSELDCNNNGGKWVESFNDYKLIFDNTDTKVLGFKFGQSFEDKDLLNIRWYNNNIGTTMTIDDILDETSKVYMNTEQTVSLVNRIEYTDYNNPSQKTKRAVPDEVMIRISDMKSYFDIIYPIGTVYENAHNPANPSDYMGFGIWKLYGEGYASVGWNSDIKDPNFALNNNDLDENGSPSHSAGGTVGDVSFSLNKNHIPELTTKNKVLIADSNGTVVIGGCQLDPDADGPGYSKYKEGTVSVNSDVTPASIKKIQPSQTVYRWIRVG